MSVYNCDMCSFYTDRKTKLDTHLNTQKHEENAKNKLNNIPPLTCGQKNVQHRILKKKEEENSVTPQPPSHQPQPPSQSVFTLLEIKNNQVLSSRQVNVTNSIINFV
jgi:hypothetical protein